MHISEGNKRPLKRSSTATDVPEVIQRTVTVTDRETVTNRARYIGLRMRRRFGETVAEREVRGQG